MAQYLMVDRLIINARVRRKIIVYTTYIDKQRHEISADLLSRKMGVGLNKANHTLQSTT